ncbi:hypothetical protein SAMN06295951_112159 [Pseudomonas panipatensis]|nr:hypothetical protein SAMN06295951_112159 [Pseudomonas panipatensis]
MHMHPHSAALSPSVARASLPLHARSPQAAPRA